MDLSAFDPAARSLVERLWNEFPQWSPFFSVLQEKGTSVVSIEVPNPPTAHLLHPLALWVSQDGEVELTFDAYRSEWALAASGNSEDPINRLLMLIRGVITEDWVAVSRWRGGGMDQCELLPNVSLKKGVSALNQVGEIRIRSWRGSFDEEVGSS